MDRKEPPIENRIKRFYESQDLPRDRLAELKGLIQSEEKRSPIFFSRPAYVYAGAALACVLLIGISFLAIRQYNQTAQLELIAQEIALNHVKRFDTEFSTSSIPHLSSQMDLLDFSPVHPRKLQYETYDLIGARYCTIDSAIAVQIHLEDNEDAAHTLYQFRDPSPFLTDREKIIFVNDIQVTLWKEGEVIMGLAEEKGE